MAFAGLPKNRGRYPEIEAIFGGHVYDRVCDAHGIRHRLTKPYHPWTDGQAERMNRAVKEATIKAFHYADVEALGTHVLAFVQAYNFAEHLKALRWRTLFQAILDAWAKDPAIFKVDPHRRPADEKNGPTFEKFQLRTARTIYPRQPQPDARFRPGWLQSRTYVGSVLIR
jgi:hypothetical protein